MAALSESYLIGTVRVQPMVLDDVDIDVVSAAASLHDDNNGAAAMGTNVDTLDVLELAWSSLCDATYYVDQSNPIVNVTIDIEPNISTYSVSQYLVVLLSLPMTRYPFVRLMLGTTLVYLIVSYESFTSYTIQRDDLHYHTT
jgi:hypothetical protein